MKILLIGPELHTDELRSKFEPAHTCVATTLYPGATSDADVVFDFFGTSSPRVDHHTAFFLDTTFFSLAELRDRGHWPGTPLVFGFCGLPTMMNRPMLEVVASNETQEQLAEICSELGTAYECVNDQRGLVTPRVLAMIINEAYFTVEEGTATREDVDIAMKLGTNYPKGPFDWCRQIGAERVVQLLDAVHTATGDVRYDVCPLLRKEASGTL